MMSLTPEQRQIGNENFYSAAGFTRRSLLKGAAAAVPGLGAIYFGYEAINSDQRVKTAFIGTGDEGSVLITEHPENYMEIVAIADIRPTNRDRAFKGDGNAVRVGLEKKLEKLGPDAVRGIKTYNTYQELLKAKANKELDVEAVVVAVPLKMHFQVVMDCLEAGLHVLTEKLMAHSIAACKLMNRKAKEKDLLLAVGHQRHYSVLYEHCNDIVRKGLLGDIKHIRALWHRNNSFPNADSWVKGIPIKDAAALVEGFTPGDPKAKDISRAEAQKLVSDFVKEQGWETLDELVNWRLYYSDDDEVPGSPKIAGGIMAELGSHQLDACSIFLGKVHPLAVYAYGGKNFFGIEGMGPKDKWTDDREIDDHVYVTLEFPGPHHPKGGQGGDDADDIVIVTYSGMSTNAAEPYGERIFGSRGTLLVEEEQRVYYFQENGRGQRGGPDQRLWVEEGKDGKPVVQTSESLSAASAAVAAKDALSGKVSRGYREEMEHFCYCIRTHKEQHGAYWPNGRLVPPDEGGLRCSGVQGMGDVVMALSCNLSARLHQRIEFQDSWFDYEDDATPKKDLLGKQDLA